MTSSVERSLSVLVYIMLMIMAFMVMADVRRNYICRELAPSSKSCRANVESQLITIVRYGSLSDLRWACEYGTCDLANQQYLLEICEKYNKTEMADYIRHAKN